MTQEEQNQAIAKVCGWKYLGQGFRRPWIREGLGSANSLKYLPDYLNDLNAMREAENTLDNNVEMQEPDLLRYYRILSDICDNYPGTFVQSATASQRAEAFLKTLNLWKE